MIVTSTQKGADSTSLPAPSLIFHLFTFYLFSFFPLKRPYIQLTVPSAVRNAVSAATATFTASSIHFFFIFFFVFKLINTTTISLFHSTTNYTN